ncbi:hypothetical protein [Nocardioides piscis]|uniref:Glycosyltransferase RgtA/B/C/D-like domain-containing protein n=1 Tax=Nocardioides piscis TaxID=2714938 RepID=A0A6G7YJI2_9ACTN|nr:hypothetical protein [Nocardioides piscis]QIK76895.1 hypothetical protein G7071_17100 [Nocardioides piscis]
MSLGLLLGLLCAVGADLLWLVAMGDHVRGAAAMPDGVPFAAAPTEDWPPVILLAEVTLSLVHELGVGGLLVWHYSTVLLALMLVALDARRRGAADLATSLALTVLVVAGIATFAVARLQTFSLVPFVLVLLLVRAQHRSPGRGMWWAPILVALWGNLHGGVLLGVCVIGAYLLFSRLPRRPVETVTLGVATLAALSINPAGWRTAEYYWGVLQNEAAKQGEGLWASPDFRDPFDLLMLLGVGLLGLLALRRRLPLWECVAVVGLTVATVVAARNGIWLLLLLAGPAAYGGTRVPGRFADLKLLPHARVVALVVAALVASAVPSAFRGHSLGEADKALAQEVRQAAPARVVLAPEPVVEALAVHGVEVWLSNPLDAFRAEDQRAYLDFMAGRPAMTTAVEGSGAVLVQEGTQADEVMAGEDGFEVVALTGEWVLYVRS